MKKVLENNGWVYAGKCGTCGVSSYAHPDHKNYLIKVKFASNIFKLARVENGVHKDVYGYTNGAILQEKLNELKETV